MGTQHIAEVTKTIDEGRNKMGRKQTAKWKALISPPGLDSKNALSGGVVLICDETARAQESTDHPIPLYGIEGKRRSARSPSFLHEIKTCKNEKMESEKDKGVEISPSDSDQHHMDTCALSTVAEVEESCAEVEEILSQMVPSEPVIFERDDYDKKLSDYNPGAGNIPHDFLRFNPTELENPLRELLHAEDTWTFVPVRTCKPWSGQEMIQEDDQEARNFIRSRGIDGNLSAFILERTKRLEGKMEDKFEQALTEMKLDGPSYMSPMVYAEATSPMVGKIQPKKRKGVITWGRTIPLGDCEAQDITIGRLHFRALDFGDTIRLSERSRIHLSNVDAQECNQCVLLHTVAGTQWAREGRKKRSPNTF